MATTTSTTTTTTAIMHCTSLLWWRIKDFHSDDKTIASNTGNNSTITAVTTATISTTDVVVLCYLCHKYLDTTVIFHKICCGVILSSCLVLVASDLDTTLQMSPLKFRCFFCSINFSLSCNEHLLGSSSMAGFSSSVTLPCPHQSGHY